PIVNEASASDIVFRATSYTSQAMTTAWDPVARVPRNRPVRKSTYGRRISSEDESSVGSDGWAVEDIRHFQETGKRRPEEDTFTEILSLRPTPRFCKGHGSHSFQGIQANSPRDRCHIV